MRYIEWGFQNDFEVELHNIPTEIWRSLAQISMEDLWGITSPQAWKLNLWRD